MTSSRRRRPWVACACVAACTASAPAAADASSFAEPPAAFRSVSAGTAGVAPGSPTAEPAPGVGIVSDERGTTYWSRIRRPTSVRRQPARSAARVGTLRPLTYYGYDEIAIVLEQRGSWSRVRYAGLGRRTGWVPTSALSLPRLTDSWVVVDKKRRLLHAYRGARRVLSARIGIGGRGSPTPGGRFFIRERLVPANKRGIYGILAFGLSAYSRHRTDWPGGGQVGIHGTNQPGLIPGRISNGCIRLRNVDVRRLDRHVGRGTPVRVR